MPRDKDPYALPDDAGDHPEKYAENIDPLISNPAGPQMLSRAKRDDQEIQYWRDRDFKRDMVQGEVSDDELNQNLANNAEDWWSEYKYTEEGDKHLRDLFLKGETQRGEGPVTDQDVVDSFTAPQRRRLEEEQARFHPKSEEDE